MPGVLQGRESFEGLRLEVQPSWLDIRSGKNISIEVSSTCAAVNYLSRSVVDAAQEIRHRQHSSLVARRRHLVTTLIVTLRPASSDRPPLLPSFLLPPSGHPLPGGLRGWVNTFLNQHSCMRTCRQIVTHIRREGLLRQPRKGSLRVPHGTTHMPSRPLVLYNAGARQHDKF